MVSFGLLCFILFFFALLRSIVILLRLLTLVVVVFVVVLIAAVTRIIFIGTSELKLIRLSCSSCYDSPFNFRLQPSAPRPMCLLLAREWGGEEEARNATQ